MKMHFASNEGCFQALTGDACLSELMKGPQNTHLLFSVTAERMCQSAIDLRKHAYLGELGPLNLFALTSGITHYAALT